MSGTGGVDPRLLEIVVCPECHGDLQLQDAADGGPELACQGRCHYVYPVVDGIPVLLVDEARKPA